MTQFRKNLGYLLFAIFVFNVSVASAVPGDSNNDGVVDMRDVAVSVAQILGGAPAPGDPDSNRDGILDVADVVTIIYNVQIDPKDVATTGNLAIPSDFYNEMAFLFRGENPIQILPEPDVMEPQRTAILRGRVKSAQNQPLAQVRIQIQGHPEFGYTRTRADGYFDIAVNGGETLAVEYRKAGFLPAFRQIDAPWRDFIWLPDVILIPQEETFTRVDLSAPAEFQEALGSVVSDSSGERQAALLLPPALSAEMTLPDGGSQPLGALTLRLTEFTVGAAGPQAMPAELPPTSGYTYAVDISADEATSAGAKSVVFSKPVYFYVDNFLNMPAGIAVPFAYLDWEKGAWVPENDGRVILILDTAGGIASLDTDGDNLADDAATLAALGFTDEERQRLAALYPAGKSLWRAPLMHLTSYDLNFGVIPEDGAEEPIDKIVEILMNPPDISDLLEGYGKIEMEGQILRENTGIAGTPFSLHYSSYRMPGYRAQRTLKVPLTGETIPAVLQRVDLKINIAGIDFNKSFAPAPNLEYVFEWDGRDAYGRKTQGWLPALISVGYVYNGYYAMPPAMARSFGAQSGQRIPGDIPARDGATLWRHQETGLTSWDASGQRLGGWSISVHHTYDKEGRILHRGDGGRQSVEADVNGMRVIETAAGIGERAFSGDNGPAIKARLWRPVSVAVNARGEFFIADTGSATIRKVGVDGIIRTVAGIGGHPGTDGDGGLATQAKLSSPNDIALLPGGSFYIADTGSSRIRYVNSAGIISTVAGTGRAGYSGDGGPATQAQINNPRGVAVAPDGTLFIADTNNNVVRRVSPDGIISTFAGTGASGYEGDGGPAVQAKLSGIWRIRLAPDGSLIIPETWNSCIRRVGADGIITTIAGGRNTGFGGDGGPAIWAIFQWPECAAIAPDGTLFISDTNNNRVRRVGADGIIRTIAGTGKSASGGDGGPALQGDIRKPMGLAFNPDGILYVCDSDGYKIRRIILPMPGYQGDAFISSRDGMELYYFTEGRHTKTYDALTSTVLYQFGYNPKGLLLSITDRDGGVTQIKRDEEGNPKAFVAPSGMRTAIHLNEHGWLARLDDPDNRSTSFEYQDDGLLTAMIAPVNKQYDFIYDEKGMAYRINDASGGYSELVKKILPSGGYFFPSGGYEVSCQTAGGRVFRQTIESPSTGGRLRKLTNASGFRTEILAGNDGRRTVKQPGGMQAVSTESPDPRFGMMSPYPSERTITTPGGLKATMTAQKTATLLQPDDNLSMSSLTESVAINGRVYQTTYTQNTRIVEERTPEGRRTATIMDDKGRVIRREFPGSVPTHFSYDEQGNLVEIRRGSGENARMTKIAYTPLERIASIADPANRTLQFEYNEAGERIRANLPGGGVINYAYDAEGNLISLAPPGRPAHTFGWTPVYQKASYSPPGIGDGAQPAQYAYNKDRKLSRFTRPDGAFVEFLMDEAGRRIAVDAPELRIDYGYNPANGNLYSVSTSDGVNFIRAFDGALPTSATWTSAVSGNVQRFYDNDFRLTSLRVNGTETAAWEYDNDSLAAAAGDLKFMRDAQSGLVTTATLGILLETLAYNEFGERTRYAVSQNGTPLFAIEYTRDVLGRIVAQKETIGGETHVINYSYDLSGALKEVVSDGETTKFTYDANGNRTRIERSGQIIDAAHNNRDQLTQQGGALYNYSKCGELKTKSFGGETTSYEYDALGSLRSATLPDGRKIEYILDGANRRIGKKIDGALACGWLYMDGLRIAAELDAHNQIISAFIYGCHAHVPDLMKRDGIVYRILTDQRGSPRLVINSQTAQIVQRLEYDAFGNVILDTNPGFQPFGFAGGLYDPDTGLTRFGVRDYDAQMGRWTTPDPFVFDGDPSNVYRYSLNDPVNYIDPFGVLESNVETIRETLWALANEETRIGGWANMKAAYGEIDCTEHALFGDPIMRYYPAPWPWDPKPYECVMASGGRFLPNRDHNIRMEKLEKLGMDDGDLDLRWFVHGYLSTTPMFAVKLGTGVAYNVATGRGFSSAGANTNNKSLMLGQLVRQLGFDLGDFAQIISGGPPADTRYQQGDQFPPD